MAQITLYFLLFFFQSFKQETDNEFYTNYITKHCREVSELPKYLHGLEFTQLPVVSAGLYDVFNFPKTPQFEEEKNSFIYRFKTNSSKKTEVLSSIYH